MLQADPRTLSAATLAILTNNEVIAVNQVRSRVHRDQLYFVSDYRKLLQDALTTPVRLVSTKAVAIRDGKAVVGTRPSTVVAPAGTKLKMEECDQSVDRQRFSMLPVSASKCKQGVSTTVGEACVKIVFESSSVSLHSSATSSGLQCATVLASKST